MSLILKGTKDEEVRCGFDGPFVNWILLGNARVKIEDFCVYAKVILQVKAHVVPIDTNHQVAKSEFLELVRSVITGGIFGWINIPQCVTGFIEEFPEYKKELLKKHEQNRIDNLHNEYIGMEHRN